MKTIKRCPECGNRLYSSNDCRCGWEDQGKQGTADHRCIFRVGDRRCPLPGTVSDVLVKTSRWFCRWHWTTRHDPALAEAVLRDAEVHREDYLAQRTDWRVVAMEKALPPMMKQQQKKSIDELLQDLKKKICL